MSEPVYPYLEQVAVPTDLHRFSDKELRQLADEVRQAILDHVSRTGGHLSSNLGTVELTVAMYAAYSIPPDKVVWDTGHQAYPHKLLTGRLDRFGTLRKHQGISGFLRREENELDVFGAGHAGTAISAALGFAAARDRLGTKEKVVAVTGDAAIVSGMSWEALNHGGSLEKERLLVILNDNRMSIAPNVGALHNYLARLRSRPDFQGLARTAKKVIERIPGPAPRIAAGLRHGITHYLAPEETGTIFEEMGFEYIGPIDGHDLPTLLDVFRKVRELDYPVFVHALTVKGKGYDVAEEDARKWHGVVPFDVTACELPAKSGSVAFTQVFGDAICELAKEDEAIVAITAAMPDGTGLNRFAKEFPERYYDTGIAEQHAVTFAGGLAAGGVKPFCAIYSTFLQRGFDQVLHDVALQSLPVRFVMDRAGLVGDDGPTHHGVFDVPYLTLMPNMALCAPRDATELREMLRFMAGHNTGPIAMRYPRGAADDLLPEARSPVEFGRWEPLTLAEDADVALVATGSSVAEAWKAAPTLAESGLKVSVWNARFIKPLDTEALRAISASSRFVVTVEEGVRTGGFGQQVRDALAVIGSTVPVEIVALPDAFVEHGPQPVLRAETGIDAAAIVRTVQTREAATSRLA